MKTFAKRTVLALAIIVALGAVSQALAGNPGSQFQGQYGGGQFQGQMGGYPSVYTPTYNVNRNYNINQNINVNRNYNASSNYRVYTPTYRVYVRPHHRVRYW